ncbi:MAG: VanZ family protein, partial [Sarcina sp.]
MKNKESTQRILTNILFIVYLIVLTWIIAFKMQFSIKELDGLRGINLIPFHESVIVNNSIDFSEIVYNIIVFIPFGVYISMLKGKWSFLKKVIPIVGTSLLYEILQFVFAIGASDITDIIGNTFGGIIGIFIYLIFHRLFKTDFKTNRIVNIIASIGTIGVVLFLT